MRADWASKNVDIAPGHRIIINEFVTKVQNMMQPKNTIKRKTCAPSESSKKQKLIAHPSPQSNESNITTNYESNTIDLADIASKIRVQIAKWQRTQTQYELRQLKEHENFELRVLRSEKPGIPADVGITCTMCDKHLPLSMGSKYASFSISNWTRHVKVCTLKKQQKACKVTQATISAFLPQITNKTSHKITKAAETMESNVEASSHMSISETSSDNETILTSTPVELRNESKQDF